MLKLYSRMKSLSKMNITERLVAKITDNHSIPNALRANLIFVNKTNLANLPTGFKAYLIFDNEHISNLDNQLDNIFSIPQDFNYLEADDIVVINPEKNSIKVVFRKNTPFNSILVTENCNNFCLMCSQPPRNINDRYLVNEILSMIPLISPSATEIGITGGEPTLLGNDLVTMFKRFKNYLPCTAIHVLTNGRNFIDTQLVKSIAEVAHPDLMFGIPLYSDVPSIHDYVVQANNAYNETLKGIINLKSVNQKVEIRVVLHKQTYQRLPQLAEFITRNLLFVDHVALMGLEMIGFTKANLDSLWIDPIEYQNELIQAVQILDRFGMNVSIYNHQLCLLDKSLWRFAKKSISDWKNEYMPECEGCSVKDKCGGFFSSAHFKYSNHIKALL
ncbi:His-Xaa-Ser system radical SAM maturase HxsC [Legionella bononiensis]|uniref:His-Xaa-Ser system radical SAM maturase HxsC n=1 Tax=Legionella bononiensis TaxID=2793102 RepID=A0ABS1W8U9_9GAMM|nr:His-Xaa-Ser system radical SAM maturase HxsC [Legionella bononiensis]MBL7479716.1 His-Xaa-Ser system radical SAM maturase HxsC [Legionella bononiensis]MBL7525771.1 His-Xaa-Ser system radical SAM maturase HxsC [Legionella bononiensis]MBL7561953.1 His-Xaa-Ser system radical SAM maturase HxsC [Legionella bononiensis]